MKSVADCTGGDRGVGASTMKHNSSCLSALREKSNKRKVLLAKSLGAASAEELPVLLGRSDAKPVTSFVQKPATISDAELDTISEEEGELPSSGALIVAKASLSDGASSRKGGAKTASRTLSAVGGEDDEDERTALDDYFQVLQEEEKVFKGSATFLKGTQSANPHNDYSQNYVDTGQRPQNMIRDPPYADRYDEHPKLKELVKLKDKLVEDTATPPMYKQVDLRDFNVRDLASRFDAILIEPPLAEYQNRAIMPGQEVWNWDMIEDLDVGALAESRAFLWLWCGSSPDGTARGRQCLRRWGFRRCEDICWVKKNSKNPGKREHLEAEQLLQRTKEHCLMGIKGTVRRSVDGDFIHANVDIDLIISEEPTTGDLRKKPDEIFLLAEHFCLGRRRLHLFGRDDTLRPGWVTVGPELSTSNFDSKSYRSFFDKPPGVTTGCTDKIELLRPKSPERGGPNKGQKFNLGNAGKKPMNSGPPPRRRQRSSDGSGGARIMVDRNIDRPPAITTNGLSVTTSDIPGGSRNSALPPSVSSVATGANSVGILGKRTISDRRQNNSGGGERMRGNQTSSRGSQQRRQTAGAGVVPPAANSGCSAAAAATYYRKRSFDQPRRRQMTNGASGDRTHVKAVPYHRPRMLPPKRFGGTQAAHSRHQSTLGGNSHRRNHRRP